MGVLTDFSAIEGVKQSDAITPRLGQNRLTAGDNTSVGADVTFDDLLSVMSAI